MGLKIWDLSYVDMASSPITGALEYEVRFLLKLREREMIQENRRRREYCEKHCNLIGASYER